MKKIKRLIAYVVFVAIALSIFVPVNAAATTSSNPQITSSGAVVIDFETGTPLFEHNARTQRVPASMIKMIAAYVVLDAVRDGVTTMDTTITISANVRELSTRAGWSNVPLIEGERYTVRELLEIVLVRSANGATVALGEGIFGSDAALISRMNQKARELNIRAFFDDSFGISAGNRISPLALAWFMQSLISDHPQILQFTSMREVTFRGGEPLANTNHLLTRFEGADGLKTGFTTAAGFCLIGTAVRGGRRLIAVTMGNTMDTRFPDNEALLEWGFANAGRITANTQPSRPARPTTQPPLASNPPVPPNPPDPPPRQPDPQPSGRASPSQANLVLDGVVMPLSAYIIDGLHYFKLRDIAFLLNHTDRQFEVIWDPDVSEISLVSGQAYTPVGGELVLAVSGSRPFVATPSTVLFNGASHSFSSFLIDGNNFFMLRELAPVIGFEVGWIEGSRTVIISTRSDTSDAAVPGEEQGVNSEQFENEWLQNQESSNAA